MAKKIKLPKSICVRWHDEGQDEPGWFSAGETPDDLNIDDEDGKVLVGVYQLQKVVTAHKATIVGETVG